MRTNPDLYSLKPPLTHMVFHAKNGHFITFHPAIYPRYTQHL